LIALESVAPSVNNAPKLQKFSDGLAVLEPKLWAASGLFMDINNYVYYGGADGRMIGVFRISPDFVELYWREKGDAPRRVFKVGGPGERGPLLRTDQYDPRTRPWYQKAMTTEPVWSAIYNDFTSAEPTITLAKAVYRENHSLIGVVATDVTLKVLSDFLRNMDISKNGIAYIIDADGYVVATSAQELPFKRTQGKVVRLLANEMKAPLLNEIHQKSYEWQKQILAGDKTVASTKQLELSSGTVSVAVSSLGRKQGLNWITVVAVPRDDFMGDIKNGFTQSVAIAIACIIIALVIGLIIVERVVRDIRKLTEAAKRFGEGESLKDLHIRRSDEIGILAQTFSEMENKLRFDRLTRVANRESLFSQINYLQKQTKLKVQGFNGFTLLFIDLDRFKLINDTYGHDAGDEVLVIIAARLRAAVRESDEVARYGGDEFVLLLKESTSVIDVNTMVEKIITLIEEPIALSDVVVGVGASIGWANFPEDGDDYVRLIKVADSRMYHKKRDRKST
jgi:diguanylate cyclase (GGDEF)-like protein